MTRAEVYDALRAGLSACACGADYHALLFHTWHMGDGALVWCSVCGIGAASNPVGALVEQDDGIRGAARRWNEYRRDTA